MSAFFQAFLGNTINLISCLFIVFCLILFVVLEFYIFHKHIKRLRPLEGVIDYLPKYLYSSQSEDIYDAHPLIVRRNDSIPDEIWKKLTNFLAGELVPQREELTAKITGNRFALSHYPPELSHPVFSPLGFVTAFLTALGILGTFLGIAIGLTDFQIHDANNAQEIINSSTKLLDGMKVAFNTSLVGLGSASFFMILIAGANGWRRKKYRKLKEDLDSIAFVETPSSILSRMDPESNNRAAAALRQAAEGFNVEIIAKEISKGMNDVMTEHLVPVFSDIRNELSTLREIKAGQEEEIVEKLATYLQRVNDALLTRLDDNAKLTQAVSETVNKLSDKLEAATERMATTIDTMKTFQNETLNRLKIFAESLKWTLDEFQSDTKEVFQEMSESIRSAVSESIRGMEDQRKAFEESAQQASATFRGIREELVAALHAHAEQERQMLEGVKNTTEDVLAEAGKAFEKQTETLASVGREASSLMDNAREKLTEGLKNVGGMLDEIRRRGQDDLKSFMESYQKSLEVFFEEQNRHLQEVLGKQREGLTQILEDLQLVFLDEAERRSKLAEEVDHSMEKIRDAAAEVGNLVNAVGLSSAARMEQLQIISRDVGKQVEQVEQSYQKAIQQLNQGLERIESNYKDISTHFSSCLRDGNEQLTGYLRKAEGFQSEFFQKADEASAKLWSHLVNAANYLVEAERYRRMELQQQDVQH